MHAYNTSISVLNFIIFLKFLERTSCNANSPDIITRPGAFELYKERMVTYQEFAEVCFIPEYTSRF